MSIKNTEVLNSRNISLKGDVYKALDEARYEYRCRSFSDTVDLLLKMCKSKNIEDA